LRLKEMEAVVCPGPHAGTARVVDLTAGKPSFTTVPALGRPRPRRRDRRAAAVSRPTHTPSSCNHEGVSMSGSVDRALVIGSSMAGLLAARR
jgi:hypothetical protein